MDIELLKSKAEQGNLEAQKELAKYYYSRELTYKNTFYWTQKAADQGDIESLLDIANFYTQGKGCEKNLSKAEEILNRLEGEIHCDDICSLKHAWAQFYKEEGNVEKYESILFQYSQEGNGCTKCDSISRYDLCKKTCPGFMKDLAHYCKNKIEYRNEYNRAILFFESLAEQGDVFVSKMLCRGYMGNRYYNFVDRNKEEYLKWLKKTAELGDADFQYYYAGKIFGNDPKKAFEYYMKAAIGGVQSAIKKMAELYESGWLSDGNVILEKNIPESMKWYLQAAEGGDKESMLKCAGFYENGMAGPVDFSKSLEWYLKSAESGSSEAMALLGQKYEEGIIVERDYVKAMEWYNKSANKGNVYGMRKLAEKYEEGILVEQDNKKALEWYSRSFNKDSNDNLALKLANMYEYGLGAEKDLDKALKYYKYAVSKKVEGATRALADFQKRTKLINSKRNNDMSYYENPPSKRGMLFTHGRMTPCPRCGSDNIETFFDGTAVCHNCKRWYAFA